MADLISRAALLDEFRSLCGPQTGDGWDNMGVRNLIMRQKAVDAVPVVRCRECKEYEQCAEGECGTCNLIGGLWEPNEFCSDGERRESE